MTNEFINLPPPPVVEDIPTILQWLNKVYIRLGGGRNNIIYVPAFDSADLPTADLENGLVFLTDTETLGVGTGGSVVSSPSTIPRNHIAGLTLSNSSGDTTNDIDVAIGEAVDSTNTTFMLLTSAITKRLDASWAVGTNQGGLDTGSLANTTYHVFLIKRSDTGVVDVLFSTSATAPTMPSSYSLKRRIGSIIRASATIVPFSQFGDEFLLKLPVLEVSSTNPGTSAVTPSLTSTIPAGIQVNALISASLEDLSPDTIVYCLVTSTDQTDTAPGVSVYTLRIQNNSGTVPVSTAGQLSIRTNTSQQIRYRLGLSNSDIHINLVVRGWIDYRGKHN